MYDGSLESVPTFFLLFGLVILTLSIAEIYLTLVLAFGTKEHGGLLVRQQSHAPYIVYHVIRIVAELNKPSINN